MKKTKKPYNDNDNEDDNENEYDNEYENEDEDEDDSDLALRGMGSLSRKAPPPLPEKR